MDAQGRRFNNQVFDKAQGRDRQRLPILPLGSGVWAVKAVDYMGERWEDH